MRAISCENEFCLIFGHPISSLFIAFAGVNHAMKTTITKVLHYNTMHGMNCGCLSKSVSNFKSQYVSEFYYCCTKHYT